MFLSVKDSKYEWEMFFTWPWWVIYYHVILSLTSSLSLAIIKGLYILSLFAYLFPAYSGYLSTTFHMLVSGCEWPCPYIWVIQRHVMFVVVIITYSWHILHHSLRHFFANISFRALKCKLTVLVFDLTSTLVFKDIFSYSSKLLLSFFSSSSFMLYSVIP